MAAERFSPYRANKIKGEMQYTSILPDGRKETSPNWHDNRIQEIRSIFKRFKLKKHQPEIIKSILSGNDTFVILPTGSGKSLCFQAPSVFFPGLTLVITPLTALIENQVEIFNNNSYPHQYSRGRNYYENIRFKAIYPGMDDLSLEDMFSEIRQPEANSGPGRKIQYKLLYVSPERLCDHKFLRALQNAERNGLRIDHVVIDEVHCLSQWGFQFRESYLSVARFIDHRPLRPIISAFTATATPKDITEIKNILKFPVDKKDYQKSKYNEIFDVEERKNLSLHVITCSDFNTAKNTVPRNTWTSFLNTRQHTLLKILKENISRVCIIYRTTVSGVDELYDILMKDNLLKDRLVKYHAQMSPREKARSKFYFQHSYDNSAKDRTKPSRASKSCKNIMIATKAFGMGIDKEDISLIIHYDMPRSLEDYYQEVGRAGRDEKKVPTAHCYLLYSVGPQKEKGTLQYTIGWVTSERETSDAGSMPVYSQFSDEIKENIYFWSYYRLCYIMKYCLIGRKNPDAAHTFIIHYLKNQFTMEQITDELDAFYKYIIYHYPIPAAERELFIKESLFQGTDAGRFIGFGQTDRKTDQYHKEINRLIEEINELHINNTYVANLLRHHPEDYEPGVPYILSEISPGSAQEWRSKKNKKVKGEESLYLRRSDINENAAFIFIEQQDGLQDVSFDVLDPDYFEAYVNEAWYARKDPKHDASVIFVLNEKYIISNVLKMHENRWKVLTDKNELEPYGRYINRYAKELFSWEQSPLRRKAEKTSSLFLYASGARFHDLTFTIHGDEKLSYFDMCVLDAVYSIEVSQKKTIYVQTIWEILTGRNPSCSSQKKLDFYAAIRNSVEKMRAMSISLKDNQCDLEITEEVFLPLMKRKGVKEQSSYSYSAIPPLFLYAEEMNGQIIKVPVSLFHTARIRKSACAPRPSIENAMLCHYLIHRIAISKNSKRGNYILFSTISDILRILEDSDVFKKKVIAILNYYQSIGFFCEYYLYITNYNFQFADGDKLTDNAYFQANAVHTITEDNFSDSDRLLSSDFTLTWSLQYHKDLIDDNSNFEIKTTLLDAVEQEGRILSPDTEKKLAGISPGRMDGIVLRHEKGRHP